MSYFNTTNNTNVPFAPYKYMPSNSMSGLSYQMNGIPSSNSFLSSSSSSNISLGGVPTGNTNNNEKFHVNKNNSQHPIYRYYDKAPQITQPPPPPPIVPPIQYRIPNVKQNIQYVYYEDESDEYDDDDEFEVNSDYFINDKYYKQPSFSNNVNRVYVKPKPPTSSYYYDDRRQKIDYNDDQEVYYEYADEPAPIIKRKPNNIVYVKNSTPKLKPKIVYVQPQNKRAPRVINHNESSDIVHVKSKPVQYEIKPRIISKHLNLNPIDEERSQSKSKYFYL
jgi:hypothetical protein